MTHISYPSLNEIAKGYDCYRPHTYADKLLQDHENRVVRPYTYKALGCGITSLVLLLLATAPILINLLSPGLMPAFITSHSIIICSSLGGAALISAIFFGVMMYRRKEALAKNDEPLTKEEFENYAKNELELQKRSSTSKEAIEIMTILKRRYIMNLPSYGKIEKPSSQKDTNYMSEGELRQYMPDEDLERALPTRDDNDQDGDLASLDKLLDVKDEYPEARLTPPLLEEFTDGVKASGG